MKERPILFSSQMVRAILAGRKAQTRRICQGQRELSCVHDFQLDRCPYGGPGDRLWVRETCSFGNGVVYAKRVLYRADDEWLPPGGKWRPSIHMPRWASRITLELTGVRVERLQEISDDDAIAEGVDAVSLADMPRQATWSHRQDFAQIWDRINAKRGPWESNPWVWVVEFRKLCTGITGENHD